MPTAPSIRRAVRSKPCGAARRASRSRCSSRADGSRPQGQPGRIGPPRAQQDTDPLGRPLRGRDYGDDTTVKVPGEIDVQRARRILEELRRRFGENFRPQLELEYIERLLKDFYRVSRADDGRQRTESQSVLWSLSSSVARGLMRVPGGAGRERVIDRRADGTERERLGDHVVDQRIETVCALALVRDSPSSAGS